MKCSPGGLSGYSGWCKAFELVVDMSVYDCGMINARLDDIVLGNPFKSIVSGSNVAERMRYGPSLRRILSIRLVRSQ